MKRLLTAIAVLAVINLLGIGGALGWLAATHRLSRERLDAVRAILHETIPEEQARLAKEQKDAEAAAAALPEPLPATPPVPSEQLVGLQQESSRAEEFRAQRLERDNRDLARTTALEFQRLDRERQAFEKERDDFSAMRARLAAVEGEKQFKTAVSVLAEGVKPAEAASILRQLIDGQVNVLSSGETRGLSGMDRAAAYLNAMDSIARGEVMSQFAKSSPQVAAELLERIRTFGLLADASGNAGP
ncbi:MAG: hypothetical protein IPJ41_14440 [Phycisphaerales bacterium]|nr:hypothetical protein [Phycisphaerales bacterium]